MTHRDLERVVATGCGGRGGFDKVIARALEGAGVRLTGGGSAGTIFRGDDHAYGISYNLSGNRIVTLRITVEGDEPC